MITLFAQQPQSMSSWVLSRLQRVLRERTATVDAVVHAPLLEPTRASYRTWICSLYGFVAAFERQFAFTPWFDTNFVSSRIKSGRLSHDLLALGLTSSEYRRLARQCEVPAFAHPLDTLGWLFVIERITLQLDDLRRRLLPDLSREVAIAGTFLDAYDGDVETQWEQLGAMVDRWIIEDGDMPHLEKAARSALDCLAQWVGAVDVPTIVVAASRVESA